MHDMIGDAFACHESINDSSGPNEETKRFFKLIEDAGQPLYPGCEEFSKLSFIVEMYHLKCMYNVSDRAFYALQNSSKGLFQKIQDCRIPLNKCEASLNNLILVTKR